MYNRKLLNVIQYYQNRNLSMIDEHHKYYFT